MGELFNSLKNWENGTFFVLTTVSFVGNHAAFCKRIFNPGVQWIPRTQGLLGEKRTGGITERLFIALHRCRDREYLAKRIFHSISKEKNRHGICKEQVVQAPTMSLTRQDNLKMKPEAVGRRNVLGGLIVLFCLAVASTAWARIPTGSDCDDCHVSETPTPADWTLQSSPIDYQGNAGCINCHSSSSHSTTYTLNEEDYPYTTYPEIIVPVVNYTGPSLADDAPILAGGNFFWVQTEDSKGHNIFSSNPEDDLVDGAPFQAGQAMGCSWDASCHRNFDLVDNELGMPGLRGRRGCTKCHMLEDFSGPIWDGDGSWLSHHRDDSNLIVGSELDDGDGYFRFLRGHQSGDGHGVCGIEDRDWQATASSVDHNEYLGYSGTKTSAGSLSALGHTATGFCCGCHGNKHISQDPGSEDWIRHPSGAFPVDGRYTEYSPQTPVSRPDLSRYAEDPPTEETSVVTPDTDMVMCLSCHRAHGSPYPKMLRWKTVGGCDDCHISTTQCAE
jgi:predicted CXXCH cytochrome family protein